jgi:hypothetical protein
MHLTPAGYWYFFVSLPIFQFILCAGICAFLTYDWKAERWTVPVNATIAKLVKVGGQAISVGGGVRYWAESPEAGPHDWGLRLFATFLFPK